VPPLVARLVRSGGAGALAAATDLATLTALVRLGQVSPRVASIPALTLGAVVMFFGQKYLAFQSTKRPSGREVTLFTLVQLGGLALTALFYDLAVRLPAARAHYVLARLVVTNLVWLGYSFPLWHFVFTKPKAP
jgi:putative flippase GtrA